MPTRSGMALHRNTKRRRDPVCLRGLKGVAQRPEYKYIRLASSIESLSIPSNYPHQYGMPTPFAYYSWQFAYPVLDYDWSGVWLGGVRDSGAAP